jgi:hypothetical protein
MRGFVELTQASETMARDSGNVEHGGTSRKCPLGVGYSCRSEKRER